MKIGVIGPNLSCQKVRYDLSCIDPQLEINIYSRDVASEAIEVIEECEEECDAIIFTGCAVENGVKSRYHIKKPYEYVSKGGTSISFVFRQMQSKGLAIDNFSIDVVEPLVLEDVLCELDIKPNNMYAYPYDSFDEKLYIEWHLKLLKEKKIDVILTSFVHVYNILEKMGLNVFYLPVTRSLVRVCYDKIMSRLALNEAKYSQISVEIIHLEDGDKNSDNYYSSMIKRCEAEKFIIDYARSVQGSVFNLGRNEYLIFTSRGCAENEANYKSLYSLQKKIYDTGYKMSSGIGTGITAYKSESNARKALDYSIKDKNSKGIFLVDESDNLRGPLGITGAISYGLISHDKNIMEISNKTDLSNKSVLKLISIIETRKSNVFDAGQLADCLDISVRSARRIMNKLISAEYGRVYAKESNAAGGRPKSLIEILL